MGTSITILDVNVTADRPNAAVSTQPSGSSWIEKAIDITITLGKGTIGASGQNTVKLSNLRVKVDVLKQGSPSMDKAVARVYGVTSSVMNSISTLGIPLNFWRIGNAMLIEAGDATNGMFTVFNGYLHQAFQDFDEVPETSLVLVAWGGQDHAIIPVGATSYAGDTDVATIMQTIATKAGWGFEGNSVKVTVSNPYLWGTALQQAHDLARMANIEVYLDTGKNPNLLAIWDKTKTRGGPVPLINARSGLVGYPKFQSNGMSFRCLFNPNIKLAGQIKMESTTGGEPTQIPADQIGVVPGAIDGTRPATQTGGPNGIWYVIAPLTYDLASQLPGGPWFTNVNCMRTDILAPG